jgi:hypothetical protein
VIASCAISGCERPVKAHGWCSMHYHRWWRHGSPLAVGDIVRHGHCRGYRSPTYNCWANMIARCHQPSASGFDYYGGRGITVCERWRGRGGFERFLADMRERPPGRILGRLDMDGDYTPRNCRWATWKEQQARRKREVTPA